MGMPCNNNIIIIILIPLLLAVYNQGSSAREPI